MLYTILADNATPNLQSLHHLPNLPNLQSPQHPQHPQSLHYPPPPPPKIPQKQKIEQLVRILYRDMTGAEISRAYGISSSNITRVAKRLGIKHSQQTNERIRDIRAKTLAVNRRKLNYKAVAARNRLLRRMEEMRAWEGKPRITRLKLKSMPQKIYLTKRYLIRKYGYYECEGEPYTLLYDSSTKRCPNESRHAARRKLRFYPADE